jgi:type I restriction enzyme S subunit
LDFSFTTNGLAFIDDVQAAALKNVTVETRDVLLNITGDSVARVCQVPDEWLPARVNQHVAIIRANRKVLWPEYLKYALLTKANKDKLLTIAGSGATRNAITKAMIEAFEITIPELPEQQSIASILSALDDKIELNLATNLTLEQMAMALYKHWFVDFGPFQQGNFIDSELGPIPEGWEVKELEEVIEMIIDHRGKTPKKLGGDWSEEAEGNFQAISAKNIKSGKIVKPDTIKYLSKSLFKKWMKEPLEDGDVLLTSEAPIGEYYLILNKKDYCLSQRLFGIRSNKKVLRPELLYCFISSNSGQQQLVGRGSGSTVQGIKQSELRKLKMVVPVLEVQNEVADTLLGYYSFMRNNDEEIDSLTTLRDTLLPKLISGAVRVKDAERTVAHAL